MPEKFLVFGSRVEKDDMHFIHAPQVLKDKLKNVPGP